MRNLSKLAAALGAAALLIAAGGGYALASSSGGTITACVRHNGGTLYEASKCAKHDSTLRWSFKIDRFDSINRLRLRRYNDHQYAYSFEKTLYVGRGSKLKFEL